MIITLIGVILLFLGITSNILYKKATIRRSFLDILETLMLVGYILGGVITFGSGFGIISTYITVDKQIYENNLERESLVKQVECISSEYEDVSKTTVIANVYDWNKEVYKKKYLAENPWTSWFFNQTVIDSLEYIELKD